MIESFVVRAQSTEADRFLDSLRAGSEKDLISHFLKDPKLEPQRKKLKVAVGGLTPDSTVKEVKKMEGLVAGFIFERIALIHLSNLLNKKNAKGNARRNILLMPEDIEEIYKKIQRIDGSGYIESIHGGLYTVISGVTMPDAIEIGDAPNSLQITRIFDAKAGDVNPQVINTSRRYRQGSVQRNFRLKENRGGILLGHMIHDVRPDIEDKPVSAVNPKIVFLCPIGSNLRQFGGYSSVEVPITRGNLHELAEYTLERFDNFVARVSA